MNRNQPLARLHSRLRMRHMLLLKTLGITPNLRRAAANLNMSQPVASTLLREVEDALGEKAIRSDHARPAANCCRCRNGALGGPDSFGSGIRREDLKSVAQGESRRLRIGVSPVAAPTLLPRAVAAFLQRYPKAAISIQTGIESTLTTNVEKGSWTA